MKIQAVFWLTLLSMTLEKLLSKNFNPEKTNIFYYTFCVIVGIVALITAAYLSYS